MVKRADESAASPLSISPRGHLGVARTPRTVPEI